MRFTRLVLLGLVAIAASSAQASAQAPPPAPAKPAADNRPFDPKDLTGIWMQNRGRPFRDYPYNAEYAAIMKKRQDDTAAGRPFQIAGTTCMPGGLVPAMTTGAYPIEIFYQKGGKEIFFQKEVIGSLYRVYMDRPHKDKDELYPMFFGDSVGHWEGDVLVVDSISLGAGRALDLIAPHSDDLHVIQRLHRISYSTLEDQITLDDPKAFTHPVTGTVTFSYHPDWEIAEYECSNERFQTDANGNQTLQGSAK